MHGISNCRRRYRMSRALGLALAALLAGFWSPTRADVKLPAIFSDHMVLQRDQKDRVWGWADPGEEVTVAIDEQTKTAKAGPDGNGRSMLDPCRPAGRTR